MSTPGRRMERNGTCPGRTPNSPRAPGAVTSSTSASTRAPRGVVRERRIGRLRGLLGHLLGLGPDLIQAAHHVEGLLGDVVAAALDDVLEAADGVLELDVLALGAGEGLGDGEGLRQEALDLAGPRD